MNYLRLAFLIVTLMLLMPGLVQDEKPTAIKSTDADMLTLRDKVKADKKRVVRNNMKLTDQQGKIFWPLYDAYQKDLAKINHRLEKLIAEYEEAYNKDALTDELVKKMMIEMFSIKEADVNLHKAAAEKMSRDLSPLVAARYFLIESKIHSVIRDPLPLKIYLVPRASAGAAPDRAPIYATAKRPNNR